MGGQNIIWLTILVAVGDRNIVGFSLKTETSDCVIGRWVVSLTSFGNFRKMGSERPLQQTTVDNTIPDNVKENQNYFQTKDSGNSSVSRASTASGSNSKSDSNSSNSPGSNGGVNHAQNPSKTVVQNTNKTSPGTNHGNMQQKSRDDIKKNIQSLLSN